MANPNTKLNEPAYKTKWTGEEYASKPWKSSAKNTLSTSITSTPPSTNLSYSNYLEAKY